MKVRCIFNTGEDLRSYEKKSLNKEELGRFGATAYTEYGLTIGKEYIVMGIILGEGTLYYLIDDSGYASVYPYPLFEIVDNKLPQNWFYKALNNIDENYPYQEAIWGYYELCCDKNHFEQLIEREEDAQRIYFRRKIELEKEIKYQEDMF